MQSFLFLVGDYLDFAVRGVDKVTVELIVACFAEQEQGYLVEFVDMVCGSVGTAPQQVDLDGESVGCFDVGCECVSTLLQPE